MSKTKKVQFRIRKIRKTRNALHGGHSTKKGIKSLFFSPKTIRYLKHGGVAIFTIAMMFAVYFQQQTGEWFKASVLDAPQPFNGTVLPVSQVPDWTNWDGDNHTTSYSQVSQSHLIDLPRYDLGKMQFPDADLIWGNASHDIIRNTKITFSVVYLGNYQFDHKENAGSHLAIDIRMPVGTPIHTIANGKVVKTSMQSTGFGHHIVIKHIGVPDPNGGTTTLYSSYVHMNQINVVEGQNVLKGDIIGASGNTGTSTTPHLHFQIDRDTAPWHPYWPFSWSEAQDAGLSFFEAVNAGLGMSNAKNHTINPISYVYQYLGAYSMASNTSGGVDNNTIISNNSADNQNQENANDTEDTEANNADTEAVEVPPITASIIDVTDEDPVVEVIDNPTLNTEDKIDTSLFTFNLIGETISLLNNGVTITAIDESGQLSQMSNDDEIRVEISGVGSLKKRVFRKSDFKNNAIKIVVNSPINGISNILIGKSNHQISFIEKVEGIASLRIEHDGNYQKNIVEIVKVIALDINGNPTPVVNFSGTISITAKEGNATVNPDRIAVNDFKNGEATLRVTVPNDSRVVLRAQNGALVGVSDSINSEDIKTFTDVSRMHPNYDAIKYLNDNSVINGYSDGTFKPDKTVNRVEALKMLMLAFNAGAGPSQKLTFIDTSNGEWYATTLGTAVSKGIVKGYDDGTFRPDTIVNKAEYLKMLFKTNNIELTNSVIANPYADVPKDAWYSEYAYMTNRRNLLDVVNNILDPASGMTRGDVAETIYRLSHILDNNLVTYSK